MSDLKECPCCGGKAYVRVPLLRHFKFYVVMCEECNLQTGECTKEEDAIKCWNNRTADNDKAIELLERKIQELNKKISSSSDNEHVLAWRYARVELTEVLNALKGSSQEA